MTVHASRGGEWDKEGKGRPREKEREERTYTEKTFTVCESSGDERRCTEKTAVVTVGRGRASSQHGLKDETYAKRT